MPFDGLTIRALTRELNHDLIETRIDKIYQPERDELVFSLRSPRAGTMRLVISVNPRWARLHVSSEKKPNPSHPPAFCMFLRKHLEGGKIKEIRQLGMERIVHIRIEALNDFGEWQDILLVCEFTGRHSNIILLNPANHQIGDAIKRIGSDISSSRQVLPGKEYVAPPSQGKLDPEQTDFRTFAAAMWDRGETRSISAALFEVYTGLSQVSAREICARAGLNIAQPVEECGEFELGRLYDSTRALLAAIDQGESLPSVQYIRGNPSDFTPYRPLVSVEGIRVVEFESMNNACDAFFSHKLRQLRLESLQANLKRTINDHLQKAYRKQFLQEGDLNQARENEKYKIWGELLTAYAHNYRKGDHAAVLHDFYSGQEITLPLDPRYTPIQNAQRFFKLYNKSCGAKKHLQRLMAENQQNIDYLQSVLVAVEQADSPAAIDEIIEELEKENFLKSRSGRSKSIKRSQPRRFLSFDGWVISVGRNNLQNDRLTLRESKRTDLWLHTKDIPGSHVIVAVPQGISSIHDIPDRTLEEAAELAAHFSQASSSPKVAVDYTFRSNVKKPGSSKPGMVIYDNYWTILVNPNSERVQELLDSQLHPEQD